MNWLIAFTRDVVDIGLMAIAITLIWEILHKRYVPAVAVSIALYVFACASILNFALVILRAIS